MASENVFVYYQKGRIGLIALVTISTTSLILVVLYKKSTVRERVASVFASRLNQTKLLIKDKELIRLLQLAGKLLVVIAAKLSPYWLLLNYEPFYQLLVATSSLICQATLSWLPLSIKEGCIWVGYMFYAVTIDPLSQVGGGAVYLLFLFRHGVVRVGKMVFNPFSLSAFQLVKENKIGGMHMYRATVRRIALTVYWICLSLETGARFVAWCCIGIVGLRMTGKGDALWANLHQFYIQPAVSNTRSWLLTEDRQLRTRRILGIVLPLVLFCLTFPPKSPSPSSIKASTPPVTNTTLLLNI